MEVNSIPNVHLSHYNLYYEDDKVIIYYPELSYEYYENVMGKENVDMHRGLMLPILNSVLKNNRGIIAPEGTLFPDNSRGVKTLKYGNKEIHLIISGGITKLAEGSGILSYGNFIYPSEIESIKIMKKNK